MTTIGTDPEFFIRQRGGKYVTAETMFPGTKEEPHLMTSGAGLQTDNVAVEFASPVANNGKELVDHLKNTFHELFKMMPPEHVLDVAPSAEFDADQLTSEQANLFGCSVSYNAWELRPNEPPDATTTRRRSIGGHIHVGAKEGEGNDFLFDAYGKINTVCLMDAVHGIISVVLDHSEASIKRRELYGKAGDHRPTDYGVEYRTLSAFWMKSPNLVMLIESLTQDVLKLMREGKNKAFIESIGADVIQNTINTGDIKEAQKLLDTVILDVLSEESKYYLTECLQNIDKYDFEKEWELS